MKFFLLVLILRSMSRPPVCFIYCILIFNVSLFLNPHSLIALREFVSCVQVIKILSSAEVQQILDGDYSPLNSKIEQGSPSFIGNVQINISY